MRSLPRMVSKDELRFQGGFTDKLRYHGKCLKIARGKVKEFDKYTCPICDWRQKIPRDAARPKLEDLQDWHAEIATLPFQPEEEEVLESIINQATAFRDFLHGFTNAACTTTEEVPTLIFYLRKIEGAEVLLTFETNFFRQEIHKWAPVAPEPPPILEQSLSTRKPRPTKQQKMMAQLGVNRPEDLPEHLRPKHINAPKRKSVDAQSHFGPSQPPSLQPAPPVSSSGQSPSTGPTLAQMSDPNAAPYPFSANYSLPASDSTPAFAPNSSSAFLPHAAASQSPSFLPRSPPPQQDMETSLFSPPRFGHEPQFASSSPRQNLDDVFADLTNQEIDPDAEPQPMENTHANEALEALVVSNGSSRAASIQDESGQNGDGAQDEPKLDGANGDLVDEEL
jgi:histone demethylase JARID1